MWLFFFNVDNDDKFKFEFKDMVLEFFWFIERIKEVLKDFDSFNFLIFKFCLIEFFWFLVFFIEE